MALVNVSKEVPATAATPMSNLTCYYTVPTTSPPTLFAPLACAICVALFFFPVWAGANVEKLLHTTSLGL
jgi:hypothetical protein